WRSTLSPIECLEWCSLDARMIAVIVGEFDQRQSPSDTAEPASQCYPSFSSAKRISGCWSKPDGFWCSAFTLVQVRHLLIKVAISAFMFGHQ
nr:hypothetical protein [Tanacetum cinerariifolium]